MDMNYCSSSDKLESVQSTDAVEPELGEDELKTSCFLISSVFNRSLRSFNIMIFSLSRSMKLTGD